MARLADEGRKMDVHTCTRPQKCASFQEWDAPAAVDVFAGCGAGLRVRRVTPVVCCREQTTAPIRVRFACHHQQAQTREVGFLVLPLCCLLPAPNICANLWVFIDFWLARWNGHANFLEAQKSTHEVSLAGCGGHVPGRAVYLHTGKAARPAISRVAALYL